MNSLAHDLNASATVMGLTHPVALVKDLVRTTAIVAGMDLLGLPGNLISPADSPLMKAVKAGAVYVAVGRISDLTGAMTGF